MSSVTELESLVVRLVGDASEYEKVMDEAMSLTNDTMQQVEKTNAETAKMLAGTAQAQDAYNAQLRVAKILIDSLRTPQERYADSLRDLDTLLSVGAIQTSTYVRAVNKLKQELDQANGTESARMAVLQKAAAVYEQVLTPLERYEKRLHELKSLHHVGAVSQETYTRAVAVAKAQLDDATGVTQQATEAMQRHNAVMERGKAVTASLLTPLERHDAALEDLNQLYAAGAINATTYSRATRLVADELQKASSSVEGFTGRMNDASAVISKTGMAMQNTGRNLTMYLTTPIVAFGGFAVKSMTDFDSAMTESLAIMSVTTEQAARMRTAAIALGKDTTHGPIKLAQSYYFLASAGLSAEQSIAALPVVSGFATAGAFDLEKATSYLADSQSALGLASADAAVHMQNMTRVSDVLVRSGILANASVEQLAISLTSKAGSALKIFNKDIEEGAAVLSAYASQGIKAELAGNALDRTLRLLAQSANENAKEHANLGLAVFDSSGEMRNIADVIQNLEQILGPLSTKQKTATMEMMGFQAEVQQVILPLLGMSEAIRGYEADLRAAGGTTAEVESKQLSSFLNKAKLLWNQITALSIEIGTMLLPALESLVDVVKDGLRWWDSLSAATKGVILVLAGFAAAMGPVLLIVGTATAAFAGIVAVVAGFLTVGGAAIGLAAAIVVGLMSWAATALVIQAAMAGIVYWIVGSEGISNAWTSATESLTRFATLAYGFLSNFQTNMGILVSWLQENWAGVFADMGLLVVQVFTNNVKNAGTAIYTIMRLYTAWQGFLVGVFERVFSVEFVQWVWKGIGKAGSAILGFAVNAAKALSSIFSGATDVSLSDFMGQVEQDFEGGKEDFFGTAKGIIQDGLADMKLPFEDFESSIDKLPEFVFGTGKEIGDSLAAGLEEGKAPVDEKAKEMAESLEKALSALDASIEGEEEETAAAKAAKKLTADLIDLEGRLQTSADTFGMSGDAIEIYKMQLRGATDEQLKNIRALEAQHVALQKQQALQEEGEQLTKAMRTTEEQQADELKRYQELLDAGAITQETFNRAVAKSKEELAGIDKDVKVKISFDNALEAGSVEAMAALEEYRKNMNIQIENDKPGVGFVKRELDLNIKAPKEPNPDGLRQKEAHQNRIEGYLAAIAANTEPNPLSQSINIYPANFRGQR